MSPRNPETGFPIPGSAREHHEELCERVGRAEETVRSIQRQVEEWLVFYEHPDIWRAAEDRGNGIPMVYLDDVIQRFKRIKWLAERMRK